MNRLFFDKILENKYREDNYVSDLIHIRIVLLLCLIFYTLFGLLDYLIDVPKREIFMYIRFFAVNPIFLITLALSFHSNFYQLHQIAMVIAYLAAGYGIVVMLILVPENFSYYGGLFLIFAVGHFLTKIYWNYTAMASFTMVVLYLSLVIYTKGNLQTALVYCFFYISFLLICTYSSYVADDNRREKFLKAHHLEGDKVVLERENYDKLLDIENANRVTIFSLAKLSESRDQFTGDHIERVGTLCLDVAKLLSNSIYKENGLDKKKFISTIELASTLHDIGKVAIPEHILMKPGLLTDEERRIMQKHTTYGYDTLMRIKESYEKNDFINMGTDICRCHHERWDGTGYPRGLSGVEIPLSARIVSVVDVYDALTSERPYKEAFSESASLQEILKGRGKMFDPEIVDVFLSMFDK